MNRPKRVFQLRKTAGSSGIKPPSAQEPKRSQTPIEEHESQDRANISSQQSNQNQEQSLPAGLLQNNSQLDKADQNKRNDVSARSQANRTMTKNLRNLLPHPELYIDQLVLHFQEKINNSQVKNVKIVNIGCSSIEYQWKSKSTGGNINQNLTGKSLSNGSSMGTAVKDPKPKFNQHYQHNVILPGEEQIFSFSFFSEIPGIFVEEFDLICDPKPYTPIPTLKIKGLAYIQDKWKEARSKFMNEIKQKSKIAFADEIVQDVIQEVKSPEPPPPDTTKPQVAEKLFEERNANQKLYYNSQVHEWFTCLYKQICENLGHGQGQQWDQSVTTLSQMVERVQDEIARESFKKRLENYVFMSLPSTPSKSKLFPMIKDMLSDMALNIGGDLADETRKSMDMWEIPFEEPSQESTEETKKAKMQERGKITAQWAKKMKKKKWGEQEEKQVIKEYKDKLEKAGTLNLLEKFSSEFDEIANFQKVNNQLKIAEEKEVQKYFHFLERMKTVKQYPLDGKKMLLKFELKLKQNCEEQLKELEEYVLKKKEQQLRLEEQKKNQDTNPKKKKAAPAKKKKGQKEEEQQKPLFFDFNSILDKESWDGLVDTFKLLLDKQPFLLIIGINYGPMSGRVNPKYSVKFLLEHFKTVQPSVQFLTHEQLFEIPHKIAEETLNEGSIYLTENLNFLPCEVQQRQTVTTQEEPQQNGEPLQKQIIKTEKLLMPQIRRQLDKLTPSLDVIIREDRFSNLPTASGISTYGNVDCILGLTWWKYLGVASRSQGGYLVFGGAFTPQKVLLVARALAVASCVFLGGEIGLKFWMIQKNKSKFCGFSISEGEKKSIEKLLSLLKQANISQKLQIPTDFIIQRNNNEQEQGEKKQTFVFPLQSGEQKQFSQENCQIVDIGPSTTANITQINSNHLFFIEKPQVSPISPSAASLTLISRSLYQKHEAKKLRHQQERNTPAGIDYEMDLIVYLIGIGEGDIEALELVEKKKKQKKQGEEGEEGEEQEEQEEGEEEEEEEAPGDQQNEVKKIELISDFVLAHPSCFQRILSAEFNYGLKDICCYCKSD